MIPDGAPGALAELERRKFTAEEGVRNIGQRALCFEEYPELTYFSGSHHATKRYLLHALVGEKERLMS